jgi:hypothetical protein
VRRLIDRLRGRTEAGAAELSDEEREVRAVEREHRERARNQGESYIRTYADPAANWGRDDPPNGNPK